MEVKRLVVSYSVILKAESFKVGSESTVPKDWFANSWSCSALLIGNRFPQSAFRFSPGDNHLQ
jgi:hypothetical protein